MECHDNSLSRNEYPDEVLNLYRQIIFEGVRPDNDNMTFTVALKECSRLSDLKTREELWCKAMDCIGECKRREWKKMGL